ncbi:NADH:flavin oxidoreductase/NADH oxidase [Inquilinus limosus]|uniref:NADH:flavin oxidoreductase/NADH oxidase n=1 Tax=Inquilinus limosus TaxID=171674 RepID=UPI00041AE58F|nr:NADH:flavin oxidoreductase/NADH oxidase [Inquilinus limosus]
MSALFSPLALGPITLPNRIVVAPMCQYSADDGSATDWHLQHWMTLAMSGAALVVVEATGVERRGRITHGCLGLYSDANERSIARALAAARAVALPGTRFGIQLAHAGRKASAQRPWEGGRALAPDQDPWPTVGPSALPFDSGWHTPEALDEAGLERVKTAFVAASERAVRLGFDAIELHMAHGYLLHSFLSPLSNRRDDRWGGDAGRRRAFPLAVAKAVRDVVPAGVALGVRVSASEWVEGGFGVEEAAVLASELKALGFDFICASSGGNAAHARVPVSAGYQVPLAREIKQKSGLVTRAVGLIVDPHQAEDIVARGDADQVALARAVLDDPRWGWHAAEALGAELTLPPQYARAGARTWPGRKLLDAAE